MALATLHVVSPAGRSSAHELEGRTVIGRPSPAHRPDVVLEPDPDRWVGRSHCTLDQQEGRWWVTDGGSVNGTYLRRGGSTTRLDGATALQHGDTLLILGETGGDGSALYWEIVLLDPHDTRPAEGGAAGPTVGSTGTRTTPGLRYDWVAARAYRCDAEGEHPLDGLRPLGHRLVRHMAERDLGHGAVACSHDELIAALWGEPDEGSAGRGYTRTDLAGVVRDVRRAIEDDPSRPQLLQTVTGFGYRLTVHRGHPG